MSNKLKAPIILFGNTRSGTTIVQKIMSAHPDIVGWYEPNALWLYADPGRIHDEFDESDATKKVKKYIRKKFYKYQKRNENCVILEKTPQNILRIPYVRAIFPEATFLFIVRSPFSFISSVEYKWQRPVTGRGVIRRLKDTPISQLHHWVRRYIVQQIYKKILKRRYLAIWGPRYKGIHEDMNKYDLLTIIARQWSVCSGRAEKALSLFENGQILRLRYEDFVDNPIRDLERISAHCGLKVTNDMLRAANELVKADRQHKWQRFDPYELAKLFPEICDEMKRHGYGVPEEIAHAFSSDQGKASRQRNKKSTKAK